jgi:hypothetical protein
MSNAAAALLLINVDPLHFTIAIEAACSVSCDNTNCFFLIRRNERRTKRRTLVKNDGQSGHWRTERD